MSVSPPISNGSNVVPSSGETNQWGFDIVDTDSESELSVEPLVSDEEPTEDNPIQQIEELERRNQLLLRNYAIAIEELDQLNQELGRKNRELSLLRTELSELRDKMNRTGHTHPVK